MKSGSQMVDLSLYTPKQSISPRRYVGRKTLVVTHRERHREKANSCHWNHQTFTLSKHFSSNHLGPLSLYIQLPPLPPNKLQSTERESLETLQFKPLGAIEFVYTTSSIASKQTLHSHSNTERKPAESFSLNHLGAFEPVCTTSSIAPKQTLSQHWLSTIEWQY